MDNRRYWIDYAKAIGIILVVYGHIARGIHSSDIAMPTHFFELTDSIIYSFHMPLFFFLSGLFFYHSLSKRGGKKLVFSKIDTLFYPYIIWSILQGTIEVALSSYTNGDATFTEVFTLLWSPRAQFWFLYALFVIFIFSTALFSLVSEKMALLVFLFSAILYIFPTLLPQGLIFTFITENLVFFTFGIVFTMYLKAEYFSSMKIALAAISIFALSQWLFHDYFSMIYTHKGILSLLLALISIITIVSISSLIAQKHYRFLAFIGASSMAIYLMHILAGSGTRVFLDKLANIDSFVIHLIVGCLVGVLAPLLVVKIIHQLKIPYVFSAPLSTYLVSLYQYTLQRIKRRK